jgi:hypothetical protein
VFLANSSAAGRALIDHELYLLTSWTENRGRCRAAGIPDEVEFATKPVLAVRKLAPRDRRVRLLELTPRVDPRRHSGA